MEKGRLMTSAVFKNELKLNHPSMSQSASAVLLTLIDKVQYVLSMTITSLSDAIPNGFDNISLRHASS